MWSRTFALFVRALRLDARLLRSHLARMALLVFVVTLLFFSQFISMVFSTPGLWFFKCVAWMNYGFSTLAAALLFATAITEEKEEQTLGLLKMANVGSLSLLLGKGGPRLLAALLILTVQFPFTLLAITLGGVSWAQVHAAYWALFAHIVFVGSVGLFASVICRTSGVAVGLTILIILGTLIGPPVAYGICTLIVTSGEPALLVTPAGLVLPWLTQAYELTTFVRLLHILATGFNEGPLGWQVLANCVTGAVLFGLAWLVFEPFNRNLDAAARTAGSPLARLVQRKQSRSKRAWSVPLIWKDFHYIAGGPTAWIAKLLVYGPFVFLIMLWLEDFQLSRLDVESVGEVLMWLTLFVLLPLECLVLAARIYRSEIRDRTWSTLMELPRSLPEVAYPKLCGCLLGLVPVTFYFGLGAALAPDSIVSFLEETVEHPEGMLGMLLYFAYLLLFIHLVGLFSVLTNAWLGALLGMVASFITIMANYMLAVMPMIMLSIGPGGPTLDPEVYLRIVLVLSLGAIVAGAALMHYLIGVNLKSAAAG